MAITTRNTQLKIGMKTYRIKEYPDLGGEPNMVDVTDLSDEMETSVPGVIASDSMEFPMNYDATIYAELEANSRTADTEYELVLQDGSKFTWSGQHTIYLSGGGVDDPVEMNLVVAPSTKPALSASD